MIDSIRQRTTYGEVLQENIKLKNPKTFLSLIKDLSSVFFYDCSVDSKGAAFEYYVRATLKGKKLGQYFTPRELIKVMSALVGQNKIVNSVLMNTPIKVLDPACGTGGFLVYLMQDSIRKVIVKNNIREINKATCDAAIDCLKKRVFYGSDANEGVAASAKMNMIIAGDGHTNIQHEDSLIKNSSNWSVDNPDCNLILTNPPFGTSETDSLTSSDKKQFDVSSTKGQYLFLQKMIECVVPEGEICTVIDEGVLNTESGKELRAHILKACKIKAIVNLPTETFKPSKINVRASLLYLEKRENDDDFDDQYKITIVRITSLGYLGSGDRIRGFDFDRLIAEIESQVLDRAVADFRKGYNWEAYDIDSQNLYDDPTHRFDFKYWKTVTREKIIALKDTGCPIVSDFNLVKTIRGKSPSADNYVDEIDGYAIVIKAGNISKLGTLYLENADWIEKSLYDEYVELSKTDGKEALILKINDILLASTGEGTLGKCCVFNLKTPAIADGHVTVIRVNSRQIDPYYLADYFRLGFGAEQVERLFTGSTGLIELTPDQIDSVVVDLKKNLTEQKSLSKEVRKKESSYSQTLSKAEQLLAEIRDVFK
jgi:type I restriction enzyme M protein